jgi:hypothetical protein
MGKSVGSCARHSAQVARAGEEEFEAHWFVALEPRRTPESGVVASGSRAARCRVSAGARVMTSHSSVRRNPVDGLEQGSGDVREDDSLQMKPFSEWRLEGPGSRLRSRLCRLGATSGLLALVVYVGSLCGLARPTTPSRHSAGGVVSPDSLTLSQEEGKMRCLYVSGSSLGHDDALMGKPSGEGALRAVSPVADGAARRSVGGPTS